MRRFVELIKSCNGYEQSNYQQVDCENIRFSSLFAAGDVSSETSPVAERKEKQMFSQASQQAPERLLRYRDGAPNLYLRERQIEQLYQQILLLMAVLAHDVFFSFLPNEIWLCGNVAKPVAHIGCSFTVALAISWTHRIKTQNRDFTIEVFWHFLRTANVRKSRDKCLAVRFVVWGSRLYG